MKEFGETKRIAALRCIGIIDCHFPLNEGEKRLLSSIMNEIRLEFNLEGAVKPAPSLNGLAGAPREWFW